MRTGPIIQFWMRERERIFMFLKTLPSSSYLTLARGGNIIRMSPAAIGIFVVPLLNLFQKSAMPGNSHPENTPRNIATKIQRVRKRSRNESFFISDIILSFSRLINYFETWRQLYRLQFLHGWKSLQMSFHLFQRVFYQNHTIYPR